MKKNNSRKASSQANSRSLTKARAQNNDTLTDYARELMNDALVTSDKLSKALCRVQRMHDNLHIQLSLLVEEVYHMHGLGRVDVD